MLAKGFKCTLSEQVSQCGRIECRYSSLQMLVTQGPSAIAKFPMLFCPQTLHVFTKLYPSTLMKKLLAESFLLRERESKQTSQRTAGKISLVVKITNVQNIYRWSPSYRCPTSGCPDLRTAMLVLYHRCCQSSLVLLCQCNS